MSKQINLIEGPIGASLFKLALPLMGISFVQMAYNLVDIMWLGRLSTEAVAAVGGVGIFLWLINAIILIPKTGLSVGMSQAIGRRDQEEVRKVLAASMQVALTLCIITGLTCFFGADLLLGFFRLNNEVHQLAKGYLKIIAIGMPFFFAIPMLSTVFVSRGNSMGPFKISGIALIFNMILDPFLIFGIGPFPKLGVNGAGLATISAAAIGTIIYLYLGLQRDSDLVNASYGKLSSRHIFDVLKLGVPAFLQSSVHACIALLLNRYVASFGSKYIAIYSIGSQLESVSWMTAEGFAAAMATFMGQNYGSEKYERLDRGYKKGLQIIGVIGIGAALFLYFGNTTLFSFFVPNDPDTITRGGQYLQIISISQFFMTLEIITTGAMNGLAMTQYPASVGAVFNIFRIPMALYLMPRIGINGIWWSMSISSILKGTVLLIIFLWIKRRTNGYRKNMDKYMSRKQNVLNN